MEFLGFLIVGIIIARLIVLANTKYTPRKPCSFHKWKYKEDGSGMFCDLCGHIPNYESRE